MLRGRSGRRWLSLATAAMLLLPMVVTVSAQSATATPQDCDQSVVGFVGPLGIEVEHWGRKARVINDRADRTNYAEFFEGRQPGDLIWIDRSLNPLPGYFHKYIETADVEANGGWKQCGPFNAVETGEVLAENYAVRVCIQPIGRDGKCSGSWAIDVRDGSAMPAQPAPVPGAGASLNGDSQADLVRKPGTTPGAFYGHGLTSSKSVIWDPPPHSAGYTIGGGWDRPNDAYYFADLNGDGRKDMIKKAADHTLQAYYNNGLTAGGGISWDYPGSTGYIIGSGWSGADDAVYFADLNGDRRADLVKKTGDTLQAYYNAGLTAGKSINWDYPGSTGYIIGTGWSAVPNDAVYFASLNGDHWADLVKKAADHTLQVYYNAGLRPDNTIHWLYPGPTGYIIGTGWNIANDAVHFPDLNGDGRADLVKKAANNTLQALYNVGYTENSGIAWDYPGDIGYIIGTGWNIPNNAVYFA